MNKFINNLYNTIKDDVLIFILCCIFVYIIIYQLLYRKIEGFNIKDIDNIAGDIKNVTKVVGDIPDKINNVDKKLTQQLNNVGSQIEKKADSMGKEIEKKTLEMGNQIQKKTEAMGKEIEKKTEAMGKEIEKKTEAMGKEIEKKTVVILTDKLTSIFKQLGDMFNNGIIKPIIAVFNGIGNIFVQIFNILKEIGNKIVSLPSCMFTYAIKETSNTFNYLYDRIMPNFLRKIISPIYHYTLRYVFDFMAYLTGYNDSVRRCYGFNVNSEVDEINSSLNNINKTFKKDFGNIDFSKIRV